MTNIMHPIHSPYTLIRQARIVNEGTIQTADVLIGEGRFLRIGSVAPEPHMQVIDAQGKYLLPGVIDGQVHFREPGLTHKADLHTESRAAVAGGVTSFIDMPNTRPNVLDLELLEEKYRLAAEKSLANFGFLLGVNGDNIDKVLAMDTSSLLALTDDGLYFTKQGELLADNPDTLERLLAGTDSIVAIHAEKEALIVANEALYRQQYGDDIPFRLHPVIRSAEGCYAASSEAIAIAEKHMARLHILHLSTGIETALFRNDIPLEEKRITTEVSVHHLWFCDADYERLGAAIKWNPAIKTAADREALWKALCDDRIDIITTDHAPHTWDEKSGNYFRSMSGAPLVQHALPCMLECHLQGRISLEKLVEKMCHNPARLYRIANRGFLREAHYADCCLVDLDAPWTVAPENILYKCGWSPLTGTTFRSRVLKTFVNGHLVYDEGRFDESARGLPLEKWRA
jgi:dihydroorotase